MFLAALYTILLGNPRFRSGRRTPAKTRFKDWYHLVGAAVEHAAKQHSVFAEGLAVDTDPACNPVPLDFAERFLSGETGEEQTTSVAAVLSILVACGHKDAPLGTLVGALITSPTHPACRTSWPSSNWPAAAPLKQPVSQPRQ